MNDDVPSRGNLLPVQPNDFAQTAPDSIAHNRTTESLLDAETKPALREIVRLYESSEVGTRTAFAGAVDGVKLRLLREFTRLGGPNFARKLQPGFIRA